MAIAAASYSHKCLLYHKMVLGYFNTCVPVDIFDDRMSLSLAEHAAISLVAQVYYMELPADRFVVI